MKKDFSHFDADLSFISKIDNTLTFRQFMEEIERQIIVQVLENFEYNYAYASVWLEMKRTTLVERAKRLGIEPKSNKHYVKRGFLRDNHAPKISQKRLHKT